MMRLAGPYWFSIVAEALAIEALDRMSLAWVRRQRSCLSGRFSEWHDGVGVQYPCHVRRAGKGGTEGIQAALLRRADDER